MAKTRSSIRGQKHKKIVPVKAYTKKKMVREYQHIGDLLQIEKVAS